MDGVVFDGRNPNWIGAALSSALRVQFGVERQNEDLKALREHIGYDISCIMDTLAEVVHAPVVTRDGATLKYVTHTHCLLSQLGDPWDGPREVYPNTC